MLLPSEKRTRIRGRGNSCYYNIIVAINNNNNNSSSNEGKKGDILL